MSLCLDEVPVLQCVRIFICFGDRATRICLLDMSLKFALQEKRCYLQIALGYLSEPENLIYLVETQVSRNATSFPGAGK